MKQYRNPFRLPEGKPRYSKHSYRRAGRGRGITLAEQIEIRQRYLAGGVTYLDLADLYGVSTTTIQKICRKD